MKSLLSVCLPLGGVALLTLLYRQAGLTYNESPHATAPATALVQSSLPTPMLRPVEPAASRAISLPSSSPVALPDQVTRALRSDSAMEHEFALHQLLPRLVAQDPAAAGHIALAGEAGPLRDEFLRQVIRLWTETDPGGALTWLTSLLDPTDRHLAAAAAIAQVAQSDRAGALDLAQLLRVGLDDGSLEHSVQIWTEDDPRAAVAWVMTQPAGPIRDRLLTRIAHVSK